MTLKVTFELSDKDLKHFRRIMRETRGSAQRMDESDVVRAAQALLEQVRASAVPGYVLERMEKLDTLCAMLTDEDWRFDSDDAVDVHVGFERILLNLENLLPPMALRFGAFSESDNTIEAKSTGAATIAPPEIFEGSGRQVHLSTGLFFALGRHKLDLAADFADTKNEYVVSFIFQGK